MIPSLCCKGGMSMVMTRVRIEPSKTTALRALTNPAVMHGVVQSSLSAKEIRALWRVDLLNGNRYLLMISPEEPDLERLAGQIGIPGEPSSKDYDAFLEGIAAGDSYRYKITGNPTVADGKGGIIPLAKRDIFPAVKRIGWRKKGRIAALTSVPAGSRPVIRFISKKVWPAE